MAGGNGTLLGFINRYVKLAIAKQHWKQRNAHNGTWLANAAIGLDNISVGRYTYGPIEVSTSAKNPHLHIGSFCSIASGVIFLTGNEHPLDRLSTYPFSVQLLGQSEPEALSKGGIVVDDDVWIGLGALILDGVHVGQGAVIAARAVVTKDVEPYAVVGGCPAHTIKKRFDEETIRELLKIDWSLVDADFVRAHPEWFVDNAASASSAERVAAALSSTTEVIK